MLNKNFSKVKSILYILPQNDRRRIYLVLLLQSIMSLLDLLGVALIGVLGALAVNGVQSRPPENQIGSILRLLRLEDLVFQQQVAILATVAVCALMARTIFSVIFTRKILFFLSRRAAELSGLMISKLLSLPLLKTREMSSQETLFAVTSGVSTIVLGVIGTGVSVVADLSLLIVLGVGLFVVDPIVAIGTYVLFGGIGLYLYTHMSVKARHLGMNNTRLAILSNERILEVLNTYREAFVRNRRQFYAKEISAKRLELADTLAAQQFMPNVGKYVIETTLVLGVFLVSAVQFISQDATRAVATLSVFMAAGTRIAPAILRIQQGAISIRGGVSSATLTLTLVQKLNNVVKETYAENEKSPDFIHNGFSPTIDIQNAYVRYPEKTNYTISNLSLKIHPGEMVAIVGESGAGKTTLVDLLLGLIEPTEGEVKISGEKANQAISKWPGAIGYVPQDSWLIDGTIAENVALGFLEVGRFSQEISLALGLAQLGGFVETLPDGIYTPVGERGTRFSGGQRQRIGIARALFTAPKLLVLDEATSALDVQTEAEITNALQKLKGDSTVIIIAHRLSTILNADKVVYMKSSGIAASGSINDVRSSIEEFDTQLKMMGL